MKDRHESSPYHNWVKEHGGFEPAEANPDTVVDPRSLEMGSESHYREKFAVWLEIGFPRLTARQKEVFQVAFTEALSDEEGARKAKINFHYYKKIKKRLRKIIADEIGLKI